MTQEEKALLLLKDLCGRLPHGVKVDVSRVEEWKELTLTPFILANYYDCIEKVKPYLRPMSSMTEEEASGLTHLIRGSWEFYDYLNAIHLDYRGLIPMGLALEAPEDMYKND